MTSRDALLQAQAISARCRTSDSAPTCGRTLHIGFFFDGFARNLEDDLLENRVSNVGRLFLAHQVDSAEAQPNSFQRYRKFYLSGLGANYDASLGAQAGGTVNRAVSDASEIPVDTAGEEAWEAAKDKLSGRSWWERMERELQGLRKNPLKALKVFRDAAINSAAEAVEPIRDSRFAAHVIKSGADVRLKSALNQLDREITLLSESGQMPLRHIKISVFGFDFGATLARAFVHDVLGRCQLRGSDYYYDDASLEVVFAGLFDAVDRSAPELPPLELFLPGTNSIEDGGLIHPGVKAVLHLVAAHERRFYRRARLLGHRRRDWREETMPGVSEDIGGGLAPGEQKASNELAVVSLHRMYRAGFTAGVAMVSMDNLPSKGRILSSLFAFNDKSPSQRSAYALVRHYQRWVGNPPPGHQAFIVNMRVYICWLAHLWRAYQTELQQLAEQDEVLHRAEYEDSWSLKGFLGMRNTSAASSQETLQQRGEIWNRRAELKEQMGWLEKVNSEAKSIQTRLQAYGPRAAGTKQNLEVWHALLAEWLAPQQLPSEIAELFSFFVHDQQVMTIADRSADFLAGETFFSIRGFDKPAGKLPTQSTERA